MRRTHISRKASESNQLLLVRASLCLISLGLTTYSNHSFTELELDEEGTRISLTIVDTPGFGDQIDNEARYVTENSSVA